MINTKHMQGDEKVAVTEIEDFSFPRGSGNFSHSVSGSCGGEQSETSGGAGASKAAGNPLLEPGLPKQAQLFHYSLLLGLLNDHPQLSNPTLHTQETRVGRGLIKPNRYISPTCKA